MARRLAAILAADVVGYSRLMAADEKGTHARLKALRQDFIGPKIAEHHGRVAKLMGDGALVEFSSVVDAVECAAAIQEGVTARQAELPEDQRIAFRIGINIGDVIVEEGDVYGDGVNVAARLEQLAGPGEICVARTVHDHAKGKVAFGFEPMAVLVMRTGWRANVKRHEKYLRRCKIERIDNMSYQSPSRRCMSGLVRTTRRSRRCGGITKSALRRSSFG
jgi:class 3 adenylate cyclase